MKLAKAAKHTGEKEAGIDLQMRLIPLPKGQEEAKKKPEKVTITIRID